MTDTGDGRRPMAWWDELLDDMDARADAYEADGWDTLRLHAGDVTALDGRYGDRVGLSVLVPDDEFDDLEATLAEATVDSYEVYRTEVQGYVAFLLSVETDAESVVLCPGYYALADDAVHALFDRATDAGRLTVYLRRLDETAVELTLEEPALLAPPEE
ncbi:hypothetical protein BRC64_11120 [Halobacteriales archaeon QH_10_67_22]|nr:MAG: hypothetical protein BRC64_11120 [Halobacteriales archaeon QH_10_67_22]